MISFASTIFSRLLILILLFSSGSTHPNPGPPNRNSRHRHHAPTSKILQFNSNGIKSSSAELNSFLSKQNVVVVAIQETKLRPFSKSPNFANYAIRRRDRGTDRGGGLCFLIHHSTPYTDLDISGIYPNDGHVELLGITILIENNPTNIINIYIPPASSCAPGYSFDIFPLLNFLDGGDALVLGGVNAHHDSWFSTSNDSRGDSISASIDTSPFVSLNLDSPTRLPTNGSPSSPDLSLASAHIASSFSWSTSISLNSNHLPILLSILDSSPPRPPNPYLRKL